MARKPSASAPAAPDPSWRVVVYYGEDAFLRAENTTKLRETIEAAEGQLDVFTFDGQTAQAADVLDECRSFGLMGGRKLVIVDNAADLVKEDNRPLFERYLQSPAEGATLVLRGPVWRGGKLDPLIEQHGAVVECKTPDEPTAAAWAVKRAEKRHDATLDRDAAAFLVSLIGANLGRIDTEIAKLAAAGAGGGTTKDRHAHITIDLVRELVGDSREEDIWRIQSEFLSPDPTAALTGLRQLLDVMREPTQKIQWALTDLARKVQAANAGLRQGQNPRALMGTLRLWGPAGDRVIDLARRASPEAAAALYMACVRADAASKRGSDAERLLEVLAIRFARFAARPADV